MNIIDMLATTFAGSRNLIQTILLLVGALMGGLLLHRVIFAILKRAGRRKPNLNVDVVIRGLRRPSVFILPLLAMLSALPYCAIPLDNQIRFEHFITIATIAAFTWALIASVSITTTLIISRYQLDVDDNLRGREMETRVFILSRVCVTLIAVIATAGALMTFPSVRALGTTLLASAGLAGIAAGVAARPILENLIAGVQIAFTQPIRLDDAVIVEGEFGRIEQITATYVVIRCWDLRRLIVPLTYFIDHPFQNWTRHTADLIGTVLLFVSYNLDVEDLRAELMRFVKGHPMWDGQVVALQVVDSTENNMQLRVLVSAKNAPTVWDFRCIVREHLISYMQQKYPQSLPRTTNIEFPVPHPNDVLPSPLAAPGGATPA